MCAIASKIEPTGVKTCAIAVKIAATRCATAGFAIASRIASTNARIAGISVRIAAIAAKTGATGGAETTQKGEAPLTLRSNPISAAHVCPVSHMTTIVFAVLTGVAVLLAGSLPWSALLAPWQLSPDTPPLVWDVGPDAAFVAAAGALVALSVVFVMLCRALRRTARVGDLRVVAPG